MRERPRRCSLLVLVLVAAGLVAACDEGSPGGTSLPGQDVTGDDTTSDLAPDTLDAVDSAAPDLVADVPTDEASPDVPGDTGAPDLDDDTADDVDIVDDAQDADDDVEPVPDPEPIPYTNPVLDSNGDPAAIEVDGTYYLYQPRQIRRDGQTVGGKVVAYTSTDLVNWTAHGEVYNNTDVAYGGHRSRGLWAPEILYHDGRFFLYGVNVMTGGADADTVGNKDIFVVASDNPLDFHGKSQKVLLDDAYAFIDPSPFVDPSNGDMFLLFKRRGAWGTGSSIRIRPMSGPRAFDGGGSELVHSDDVPGSENIVEHPMIHHQGGVYFFLYSFGKGDAAGSDGYRVRYATANKAVGPYTERGILLGRNTVDGGKPIYAPGATSIVRDGDNRAWLVYRQKTTQQTTFADRAVCIDRIRIRPNNSPPSMHAVATRGIEIQDGPTPLSAP